MLRAALLDSSASLFLVIAGLPFGVIGVAAFYAIGGLLVRAPLAFWLGSRRGPVTLRDLCRAVLPSICAAGTVGMAIWLVKRMVASGVTPPLAGLAMAGTTGAVAAGIVFFAIPQSRRALASLAHVSRLLRGRTPAYRG
jgi:polysaccharide transporter, PST family